MESGNFKERKIYVTASFPYDYYFLSLFGIDVFCNTTSRKKNSVVF